VSPGEFNPTSTFRWLAQQGFHYFIVNPAGSTGFHAVVFQQGDSLEKAFAFLPSSDNWKAIKKAEECQVAF
jgi:hypothetical protein